MSTPNPFTQKNNQAQGDLLVEFLEASEQFQQSKKNAYKQFYQARFPSASAPVAQPAKSSMFNLSGFLQAFGAMCLVTVLLVSAWLAAENTGLISTKNGTQDGKTVNLEISSFEDCRQAGGEIFDDMGTACLFGGQVYRAKPVVLSEPNGQGEAPNEPDQSEDDLPNPPAQEPDTVIAPDNQSTAKTCTQEIKYCADGSIVRRDPKNDCQFMPCAETLIIDSANGSGAEKEQISQCSLSFDGVCPAGCAQETDADCCRNQGGVIQGGQCAILE